MPIIASHCPEDRFVIVDINEARIAAWQSDQLPIYEPGLDEIVWQTRDKNLFFSTEIDRHIAEAEIILDEADVALVPGEAFGPSGYLRLSYALAEDQLVEGASRIKALLEE